MEAQHPPIPTTPTTPSTHLPLPPPRLQGWLLERYVEALRSVRRRLLRQAGGAGGLWYIGEESAGGGHSPKMDHLVCFLPGGWDALL